MNKFWLRPAPDSPLSGPYTEAEATARYEAGAYMWPEQAIWIGPNRKAAKPA